MAVGKNNHNVIITSEGGVGTGLVRTAGGFIWSEERCSKVGKGKLCLKMQKFKVGGSRVEEYY